jgi:serine protease Do
MSVVRSICTVLMGLFALAGLAHGAAPPAVRVTVKLPAALEKKAPIGVADLKAIQEATKRVLKKCIPATVGLRIGPSAGSGVIVSEDGIILTAGHVSGTPGQDCEVFLSNGKTVKGKTLGRNSRIDSGMIKITTKGKYPFVDLGKSAGIEPGKWCIAIGHPRGYIPGRSPVVRVGRVVFASALVIRTDCALVGGDSGGPLFDFEGKLIGIHSRINTAMEMNFHVPVDTYRETWDRLKDGESIGLRPVRSRAYMGVAFGDADKDDLVVDNVPVGMPAEKAGVKAKDVITQIDDVKLKKRSELFTYMAKKKVGDTVKLTVLRDGKPKTFSIKLVPPPG